MSTKSGSLYARFASPTPCELFDCICAIQIFIILLNHMLRGKLSNHCEKNTPAIYNHMKSILWMKANVLINVWHTKQFQLIFSVVILLTLMIIRWSDLERVWLAPPNAIWKQRIFIIVIKYVFIFSIWTVFRINMNFTNSYVSFIQKGSFSSRKCFFFLCQKSGYGNEQHNLMSFNNLVLTESRMNYVCLWLNYTLYL